MKKINIALMFIVLISFFLIPSMGQELRIIMADSISNSQSEVGYLDLRNVQYDSIVVSLITQGEIDLDSLDIKGGFKTTDLVYQGTETDLSTYEAEEGVTLTVNSDSGAVLLWDALAVITANEGKGYNSFKFTITGASSGNVATDPGQKYLLYAQIYRQVRFNK